MIEPFKYLLQPFAIERDDTTGRILREMPGQVMTIYNVEQALNAIVLFEKEIEKLQEQGKGEDEHQRNDNAPARRRTADQSS